MANLGTIEALTKDYAEANNTLADEVKAMEKEIDSVKMKWLKRIKPLAEKTAEEKAVLFTAIDESRELFQKPRSYTIAGIKVGLQKKKGTLQIADKDKTIELIKKKLAEKAEILIKDEPKIIKKAIENLTVKELKSIGVEITKDSDDILIKSDADKIEKFINSLIEESVSNELKEAV